MELTPDQQSFISKKINNIPCPLCGGKFLYFIQALQLLSWKGDTSNTESLNLSQAQINNYLCAECQSCGYSILRRLDILLKDFKKSNISFSD